MNIKNFKTLFDTFYSENSISSEVMDKWFNIVQDNYQMFVGKGFDEISEILNSLAIEVGVDEQVVVLTASIIAYNQDAKMNIDKGCSTVFMMHSKVDDK